MAWFGLVYKFNDALKAKLPSSGAAVTAAADDDDMDLFGDDDDEDAAAAARHRQYADLGARSLNPQSIA